MYFYLLAIFFFTLAAVLVVIARDHQLARWGGVACVAFGILCVFGGTAYADELKKLEWTAPTECTNDAAIGTESCTALDQYRFTCSADPGPPYDDLVWLVDAPALSDERAYPPGDYYCRLAVSNAAGFSEWSSPEFFFRVSVPPSVPRPPTITTAADSGS